MRPTFARSAALSIVCTVAAAAHAAAQAAPAPAAPDDPTGLRARSDAFRDSVDRALDRASGRRDPFAEDETPRRSALARRIAGGVSVALSQPLGDFRRGGRVGFGAAAYASISADPAGVLGLRLEGGAQNYGTTSLRTTPASVLVPGYGIPGYGIPGYGYSVAQLRQRTSNDIFWLGIGPQVTIPLGPVRPYGFATVGGANFTTSTTLNYALLGDPYGYNREFQSTDLSNWAFARAAGGGIRFRVGAAGRRAAFVDAGARWQRVNDVRYLAPGAVPADVDPNTLALRGRADFVTYHQGVSVTGR